MAQLTTSEIMQAHMCIQKLHPNPIIDGQLNKYLNDEGLKAIFMNGSLWDLGSTITVSFLPAQEWPIWYNISDIKGTLKQSELDIEMRARKLSPEDAVELIVTEIVAPAAAGISFEFVKEGGDVRVQFMPSGGSSSLVGTQCLSSQDDYTVTFGWMDVGTIVHEFFHVLGMLHEHQNPQGGIKWDEEAVYEWAEETQGWDEQTTFNNILKRYATNQITGSVFDSKSVMLYFFPAELTANHMGTKQNLRPSEIDIKWINAMYPEKGERKQPPTTKTIVKGSGVKIVGSFFTPLIISITSISVIIIIMIIIIILFL